MILQELEETLRIDVDFDFHVVTLEVEGVDGFDGGAAGGGGGGALEEDLPAIAAAEHGEWRGRGAEDAQVVATVRDAIELAAQGIGDALGVHAIGAVDAQVHE